MEILELRDGCAAGLLSDRTHLRQREGPGRPATPCGKVIVSPVARKRTADPSLASFVLMPAMSLASTKNTFACDVCSIASRPFCETLTGGRPTNWRGRGSSHFPVWVAGSNSNSSPGLDEFAALPEPCFDLVILARPVAEPLRLERNVRLLRRADCRDWQDERVVRRDSRSNPGATRPVRASERPRGCPRCAGARADAAVSPRQGGSRLGALNLLVRRSLAFKRSTAHPALPTKGFRGRIVSHTYGRKGKRAGLSRRSSREGPGGEPNARALVAPPGPSSGLWRTEARR